MIVPAAPATERTLSCIFGEEHPEPLLTKYTGRGREMFQCGAKDRGMACGVIIAGLELSVARIAADLLQEPLARVSALCGTGENLSRFPAK